MKLGLACFILFQLGFCLFVFTHPTITGLVFDSREAPAGGNQRTLLEATVVEEAQAEGENEFLTLATKAGTDKVTTHQYHHAYHTFLAEYRHKPVKMLEIGLGCNMNYGPGKSAALWNEYFTHPEAKIYFMEGDKNCLDRWGAETLQKYPRFTLSAGDQGDVPYLNSFVNQHGPKESFDIIIDDGGHNVNQQWTSLHVLFDLVKPGGLYIIEDLLTSFMGGYGGDEKGQNPLTMVNRIKAIQGSLYPNDVPSWMPENLLNRAPNVFGGKHVISRFFSVHVWHEIVVFEKYNGQKVALY